MHMGMHCIFPIYSIYMYILARRMQIFPEYTLNKFFLNFANKVIYYWLFCVQELGFLKFAYSGVYYWIFQIFLDSVWGGGGGGSFCGSTQPQPQICPEHRTIFNNAKSSYSENKSQSGPPSPPNSHFGV